MFKTTLAAVFTLLIFMGSTAFADGTCDKDKVAGAYLRQLHGVTPAPPGPDVFDQLLLTSDGTAYWYQSTAFDFLVTGGSFIPGVGSWKCIDDYTLVVTVISVNYHSLGGDIEKDTTFRFTQKISVVDSNTLKPLNRVTKVFALTVDPLSATAVPLSTGQNTNQTLYKRIKPFRSDVP